MSTGGAAAAYNSTTYPSSGCRIESPESRQVMPTKNDVKCHDMPWHSGKTNSDSMQVSCILMSGFPQVWLTTISAATPTTPTTSTKLQQSGALRPIPVLSGKPVHLWVWLLQLLSPAFGFWFLLWTDSLAEKVKFQFLQSAKHTMRSAPMDMPSPTTMSELCWKSAPTFFGFWPLSMFYWCAVSLTGHLSKLCLVMSHDSSQAVGWWDGFNICFAGFGSPLPSTR